MQRGATGVKLLTPSGLGRRYAAESAIDPLADNRRLQPAEAADLPYLPLRETPSAGGSATLLSTLMLGISMSISSSETVFPHSIFTSTLSGSTATCFETTARTSSRRIGSSSD